MSSGTYFPPAVKAVPVPKKSGGVRSLDEFLCQDGPTPDVAAKNIPRLDCSTDLRLPQN